ncbi:S9 family peptidase [Cytobacillus oceanisediminis]|uniref:S9 family peptidase n=1 Tax=Cytobacillus oceanisediminis TaxID=665099 RepID=UPI0020B17C6A|nr:alpha/beta fold hydrolase [Cytobacillus oceanisediminis]
MNLPDTFSYPLTFFDQSIQSLQFDKKNRFIVIGYDHHGNENTQLYVMQKHGGEIKPLRTQEGDQHIVSSLSKDGKKLYYSSTKGNKMFLNSYCYDMDTGEEDLILEGDGARTYLIEISPEKKSFMYIKTYSNTHTVAYVQYDNNKRVLLTPSSAIQHNVFGAVYVSEEIIYLITNYDADSTYLASFNLATNEFSKCLSLENESFSTIKYDKQRNSLYLTTSSGIEDSLYQFDLLKKDHKEISTPISIFQKLEISKSGDIFLLGKSATKPSNIYQKQFNCSEWKELTYFRVPGIKEELIEPEVFTYSSFDGLEIEALYYKGNEEISNGHLILWPHGGPQASERKMFSLLFQFLLNQGYSIFAPNFRGSTGYGAKFSQMVEGDWGDGPRLDIIHGIEWMIERGYADREKLLLMGKSYGGYMTLLLAGRHPDYFKAGIDMFGPSNLFTLIESVPDAWKPMMKKWIGDPDENKDRLIDHSPITYINGMKMPLLVIQGANDPRVVKAESDQIVNALQEKGIDVEYLVLEDEGHGFSKKENEMKVYRKILEFFDRFI